MDLGVTDRVAMVAASSKGLGYGVAKALAMDGARVSMCSRTESEITDAAQRLQKETNGEALATACDVTDPRDLKKWLDRTLDKWGRVDMLLANTGGPPAASFKELTDEQWQSAFELTLMSTIRMIRMVLPHMQSGSAILTITSSSVREPIERLGLSNVMRSGVVALVKTLADELSGDGIRINNLIPGRIDTDRVDQLDRNTAQRSGLTFEEVRRRSQEKIPLQRLGSTDEFGSAGAFLLSPAASYITGTSLVVDGGTMRSI